MEGFFICYSMRKRRGFSLPALTQNGQALFKESKLETHDVAMTLPPSDGWPNPVFRAICLSPQDVGSQHTRNRIERLYHLNGGQNIAIIFLLKAEGDQQNPVALLMRLQLDLASIRNIPIIPIEIESNMEACLTKYYHQLCRVRDADTALKPASALLPYCSVREPLSEHAVNILTDMTCSFPDMVLKMTNAASRAELEDNLGNDACRAVSFWEEDFLID
ncbi:hypothetical protein F5Y15DRAFT_362885 [Xylariaceae sp. FL0016]|nr:hypothetical protein F5Y15DRAFT_362885 [Xylariaceae sp. FL0016]